MRIVLALILSFILTGAQSSERLQPRLAMPIDQCFAHLPYGQPKSARQDTSMICREGYVLEHDNKAKIPAWVAYTLTPEHAVGCYPRISTFKPDPSIDIANSAKAKDYAKSGYDIGHMANDGDMRWDPLVEAESNLFANAAPQLPGLNRGSWKMLEDQTRAWTLFRQHNILIYVGPVYEKVAPSVIGVGRVTVPLSFFKILIDQETNEVLVFLYPQQDSSAPPSSFQTSLAIVQGVTGIVFPMPQMYVLNSSLWRSDTKSARTEKSKTCVISK